MAASNGTDRVIASILSENLSINGESVLDLNFVQSIDNFDLSLLGDSVCSKIESLSRRVVKIEETLGIYQLAVWKIEPDNAVKFLTSFCRDKFGWSVSEEDFTVVQRLDCRRKGVLVQVASLELKQSILVKREFFEAEGSNRFSGLESFPTRSFWTRFWFWLQA